MKNLILILLFLFTSSSLSAVNKEIINVRFENKAKISNSVLLNQTNILFQSFAGLFENDSVTCKIEITVMNEDGEVENSVSVETNTETEQECHDLRDFIVDFLLGD